MKIMDSIAFNTDVQLSEAKNMNEVKDSDHLFVLTDKISEIKKEKSMVFLMN